jgi:hypothetical protein
MINSRRMKWSGFAAHLRAEERECSETLVLSGRNVLIINLREVR